MVLRNGLVWYMNMDGFGMLGQLSNVTRVMNAQAITETYSNVIPRYVMFHLVYRFQKSEK